MRKLFIISNIFILHFPPYNRANYNHTHASLPSPPETEMRMIIQHLAVRSPHLVSGSTVSCSGHPPLLSPIEESVFMLRLGS